MMRCQKSFFLVAGWSFCLFEIIRYWRATNLQITSLKIDSFDVGIQPKLPSESNEVKNYQSKICPGKKPKIVFVKTFKTGSTTVQNILFRHGVATQSTFVLPLEQILDKESGDRADELHQHIIHLSDGSLLQPLQVDWLKNIPWHEPIMQTPGKYDILAVHHIWNQDAENVLLGTGPKVRMTILRNPSHAYESIFNGFRLNKIVLTSFADFVIQVKKSPLLYRYRFGKLGLGLNQQLAMFGLIGDDAYYPENVEKMIKVIDEKFDLVMIMELMDESLVLLADLMCWTLEKVATLLVNARIAERKYDVSPDEEKKVKTWQWPDEWLYDHFHKKLRNKIKTFGEEKMKKKVDELRSLQRTLVAKCVDEAEVDRNSLEKPFKPWNNDIQAHKIRSNPKSCFPYGLTEEGFVSILRNKQLEEWTKEKDDENT